MKEITIKVFPFSELSEKAKQKALDKFRDINTNYHDWEEPIIEGAKEDLENLGYKDIKILYSGFGSQGDGACFTARVNIQKWLKRHKLSNKYRALYRDNGEHFSFDITHHWRYYFASSTNVEQGFWDGSSPKAQAQAEEVLKRIEAEREKLGNRIYRDLETYYFELQEDEAVIDTIEANEYTFREDGTLFIK